ncbi:uncharacterized protein LOC130900969 [Diorhabda carinulata]|uniref:uncharacterized protein LOC130900969 n=1 Tax=Diorhabda carinulata TaxID=1163345 RepID=UPI0025A2F1CD|nr:uncharacterized protein LOC130900969 [Diorhabda carinulata]
MKSVLPVFVVLIVMVGFNHVIARPNNRMKRVSDSHLADLETKIAMNNRIKGFAITMPIGGGKIDPLQIGRKRRSGVETRFLNPFFQQKIESSSEEDNTDDYEYIYNNNYLQ